MRMKDFIKTKDRFFSTHYKCFNSELFEVFCSKMEKLGIKFVIDGTDFDGSYFIVWEKFKETK